MLIITFVRTVKPNIISIRTRSNVKLRIYTTLTMVQMDIEPYTLIFFAEDIKSVV